MFLASFNQFFKFQIPAVDYVLLETDKEFNASPAWQTKQMGKWPLDVVGFPDYNDKYMAVDIPLVYFPSVVYI